MEIDIHVKNVKKNMLNRGRSLINFDPRMDK